MAWIVSAGIFLVVTMSAAGYIIANPESLYRLFGGSAPKTAPVAIENGSPERPTERVQPPHTKHYANLFYQFDYPEEFTVTDEIVNARRTADGGKEDAFGTTEVTLTATTSEGTYVIKVGSALNADHADPANAALAAKTAFAARPDRGPNDSFQDITIGVLPAYKDFTTGRIHIGIPSDYLNYSAEIVWKADQGVKGVANSYLGVFEDSFATK